MNRDSPPTPRGSLNCPIGQASGDAVKLPQSLALQASWTRLARLSQRTNLSSLEVVDCGAGAGVPDFVPRRE